MYIKREGMRGIFKAFQRYGNKRLSLDKRFMQPDDKSNQLAKMLDDSLGDKSLVGTLKFFRVCYLAKHRFKQDDILYTFYEFTSGDEEGLKTYINHISNMHKTEVIQHDDRLLAFKVGDKIVQGQKLSKCFPLLQDYFIGLEKGGRVGSCHWDSVRLLQKYSNFEDATLVTGIIQGASSRCKWLHSWVEQKIDGVECCIDTTFNLLMPKQDYYWLRGVRVLEKLSQKQVEEDGQMIDYLENRDVLNTKLYCYSRKEAVEKYKKLLRKEKSEREAYERKRAKNEKQFGTKYISDLFMQK